jgi:acetoin utilization deacetylase AcuC-like enzyme
MKIGYVYDPIYLEHDLPGYLADEFALETEYLGLSCHPENSGRLKVVMDLLKQVGLLARLKKIEAAPVSNELLCRIHDVDYVSRVRETARSGGGMLDPDSQTYVGERSYDAALMAAGGAVAAVEAVLTGEVESAFALVRPPGHHAGQNRGAGFCLFNNVAIAAEHAVQSGMDKVLVVDYDVHHGDGVQDIFYEREDVLYFSVHQYPGWPWTGHWEESGVGKGAGYTVNVPVPWGAGDEAYERVFDRVLQPLVQRFAPQLIVVAAGYDAHWRDPLSNPTNLSARGYRRLAEILARLAEEQCPGRLVFVLEGGYDAEALSYSVAATCAALLDEEAEDPIGPSPQSRSTKASQEFFWEAYPAIASIPLLSGQVRVDK